MSIKDLQDITPALYGGDETERCYAVEDLQEVRDRDVEIVPHLIKALEDRSIRVREMAVDALSTRGGLVVSQAAAALLDSENVPLRNAAIEILEKIGPIALETLKNYFSSSSSDVRKFTIDTVGKIISEAHFSNQEIFSLLTDSLWDTNENVAGAAAEALGFTKDDSAIPFLLEHTSGPNHSSWLQCNIVVALSRISTEKSRNALEKIIPNTLSGEAKIYLTMALNGEKL